MSRRRAAVAVAVVLAVVALAGATAVLSNRGDPGLAVAFVLLSLWLGVALGAVGAFLLGLRPENALGPVLLVAGSSLVVEYSARAYAYVGLEVAAGGVPGAAAAGWFGHLLDPIFFPASLIVALLLFPDGRLPSRWWRIPILICALVVGVEMVVLALRSGPIDDTSYGYSIPWGGVAVGPDAATVQTVVNAGTQLLLVLIPLTAIELALQFRRAGGLERQQFRPLLLVIAVAIGGLALQASAATTELGRWVLVGGVTIGLPAALAVATLRYRLWDVDRIIVATIVYAAMAALATVLYVAVVVAFSQLGGPDPEARDVGPAVVATVIVALVFASVRDRLAKAARRLVYGVRASPYEALASLPHRLADAPAIDDVLPQTAAAVAGGLGVPAARVRAMLPDGSTQAVWFPAAADGEPAERTFTPNGELAAALLDGAAVDVSPQHAAAVQRTGEAPVLTVPIRHLGETVGDIAVLTSRDRVLGAGERQLLADLAAQAGPAVRGVGLTAQLRAQLAQITGQAAELRASRERLAVEQMAERRRIERDIHDGAQYQLVNLSIQLQQLQAAVLDLPEAVGLLRASQATLSDCIDQLRELARGVYPPVLAARGLAAALRARARAMTGDVRLVAAPDVDGARFAPTIELAVYFCCSEALQNAAKHAPGATVVVRLEASAGSLCFEVADDGPGFSANADSGSGLVGMHDRLGAVGGEVDITSVPGRGTTVVGRVPLDPSAGTATPVPPALSAGTAGVVPPPPRTDG